MQLLLLPLRLVASLAGCLAAPADTAASGTIAWSGYVYTGPQDDVDYTDGDAGISFTADDAEPVAATAPYPDYPGYWSANVPPSTLVTVRVETDPPAVWRVTTPDRDASWFRGALLGAEASEIDALLAGLGAPARGSSAMVIGSPWDDGWDCANVRVAGTVPLCFVVDSTGVVTPVDSGDISYFVAPEVPAGAVDVESGLGGVSTYTLAEGEVGMAFWFVGK